MNEAELMEVAMSAYSNSLATLAIYITLLMGYIVAAYIIGEKLVGSQAAIISTLYSLLMVTIIAAFVSFIRVGYENAYLAWEMSTQRKVGPVPLLAELGVVVMVFCYLASLKFMWDVRHPKTECP
jgi:hypothetical protein